MRNISFSISLIAKLPMNARNSFVLCCFVSIAALLSACSNQGAATPVNSAAVDAVPVEVALASRGPISASYAGTAPLVADHEAEVTAKVGGVMEKLFVEEGAKVKAGQLLAQLDDADTRIKAVQAEAQMHKAEATFAHAQAAMPKHLIAEFEYEQDKFDLAAQRAAYQGAQLQLSYTRILAPVDGVIAERSVKVGNTVQPNQQLFRIVGMDPLQAVLNVPERQLGILKISQTVQLQVDALPGRKFTGSILRIAPVVDPASGTFRVTCQFHDDTGELRPGMFTRIDIVYDRRNDALTIPRSALIEEDGQTAVFVVDPAPAPKSVASTAKAAVAKVGTPSSTPTNSGFVAHRQVVKTGYSDGDKVEILSGINPGTRVVTIGRNAVRDGTAIVVLGDKA